MEKYNGFAVAGIDVADLGVQNLYSTPRQMIGAFRLRCCRDRLRSCNPDTPEANSRHAADHEFSKRAARDVRSVEPILRRLLVPVGEACAICHLSRPSSETCWVLVIGTHRKTKDRERCRYLTEGIRTFITKMRTSIPQDLIDYSNSRK